ncbi:MAG: YhbY family RNA-binding protein [Gammaproteobacteria bacterium]|jgi:RNA-binding protein
MLSQKHRKQLRQLAHHRKVIVIIGQHGLTDNVMAEIDQALEVHELVKVRVNAGERATRDAMIDRIAEQTHSDVVQRIGHIGTFFRRAEKPRIALS